MIKHTLISILLIFVCQLIRGQSNICFEDVTGSFWPIKPGRKLIYSSKQGTYTSIISDDSIQLGDKYYLKEIKEYANGDTKTSYWREENEIVYFYDIEKKAESIELINDLTPGNSWEKYDKSWKYTIVDTTSTFSTPFCDFNNLLEVKAEPQNEQKQDMYSYYNLFYKRGVGMVGMNVNGSPYMFAKSENLNEKGITAYGCEKLQSIKEQDACTTEKIIDFIQKEIEVPKKKNMKSGRILVKFIIDVDGKVESASIIESFQGAEALEKELLRVVKKLPKMIPAQVDDNKPIKFSYAIPFIF